MTFAAAITSALTIPHVIDNNVYSNELLGILSSSSFSDDDYSYPSDSSDVDYNESVPSTRKSRKTATRRSAYNSDNDQSSFLSIFQNQKQLGATLLAIGLMLSFLGMILLFEKNLLRLGNICLVLGKFWLIFLKHKRRL